MLDQTAKSTNVEVQSNASQSSIQALTYDEAVSFDPGSGLMMSSGPANA